MALVGLADVIRDENGKMIEYKGLLSSDHPDVVKANEAITGLNVLLVTRARDNWSPEILEVRRRLAAGDDEFYSKLTEPKEHWDPEFKVVPCETRGELYAKLGEAIGKEMSRMAAEDGGTFTLACGPVPNFKYAADAINRRGAPLAGKVFLAAMDDWAVANSDGELYFPAGQPGSFATTFEEVFLGYIRPDLRPNPDMVEWGTVDSLSTRTEKQLKYERRGINYGVGRAMHRAFWDPNHAKALIDAGIDPRNVVFLAGARVTEETITGQNDITGYMWGCPSDHANTIGPVALNDVPTFGLGGCDGFYSECGESWQLGAIQTVLALPKPDITGIASYLVSKPGELYILEKLLQKPSGEVH